MDALRTVAWAGLVFALTGPLYAQDAEPSMADQVKAWVRRLDSDTLEERDRAEQKIIELGHKSLDYLPQVKPSTAAETKARLQRIRTILEKARADAAAKSSKVTLTAKDKPFPEVIAAIQEQTGNQLIDYRRNFGQNADATKVTVDWKETPFWEALDELFAQTGLEAYHYAGQPGVLAYVARQSGTNEKNPLVQTSEIFRFEPTRIESFLNLSNPSQRGTFMNLQVAWEPRVTPIVLKLPLDQLQIEDENGKSLITEGSEGSLDTEVLQGVSAVDIQLPLGGVDRTSQKIAKLKGQMVALLPGRVETFTFDKLEKARNVKETRGAIEVIFEAFRPNGDIYEASVMLRVLNDQGALESHRGWVYNNEAYLKGPNGERVDIAGFEETYRDVDTVGLSYKFVLEREASDYQFVYRSPASIISLPVSFELKDIPLP
ncbi:hypothetical protein C5Y97_11855 [Blastopirellula marina]|uniref:Uncharacterized protein n=2 Tax=Blastopirellula marina TaxID=124 RepID=A0A2S8FWX4_9BACT|nr:hypothetical protein C5Y98_11845 [Blastopirellula marina]PTL44508.1 hypothetical protein C5Y97_11855 [Blastopirellula marina]